MEAIRNTPFVLFNFCSMFITAHTNNLVAHEKSVETFMPTRGSMRDRSDEQAIALSREANAIVEEFIDSYSHAHLTLTFIQGALIPLLAVIVFFYFIALSLTSVYVGMERLLIFRLLSLLLLNAEQECAAPRDVLSLIVVFCYLLFVPALSILFGYDFSIATLAYITVLCLAFMFVLLIPFNLIYNWGIYFPTYVKGQSIKKNIIFEWLTDCVHLLSFFLRINVQLIRLVIVAGVLYIYNDLYIEFIHPTLLVTPMIDGNYEGAAFFLKLAARLLYEIGHLWLIVGMQSGAFAAIVFVITQFLYSVYFMRRLIPFLKNLRSRKKN